MMELVQPEARVGRSSCVDQACFILPVSILLCVSLQGHIAGTGTLDRARFFVTREPIQTPLWGYSHDEKEPTFRSKNFSGSRKSPKILIFHFLEIS